MTQGQINLFLKDEVAPSFGNDLITRLQKIDALAKSTARSIVQSVSALNVKFKEAADAVKPLDTAMQGLTRTQDRLSGLFAAQETRLKAVISTQERVGGSYAKVVSVIEQQISKLNEVRIRYEQQAAAVRASGDSTDKASKLLAEYDRNLSNLNPKITALVQKHSEYTQKQKEFAAAAKESNASVQLLATSENKLSQVAIQYSAVLQKLYASQKSVVEATETEIKAQQAAIDSLNKLKIAVEQESKANLSSLKTAEEKQKYRVQESALLKQIDTAIQKYSESLRANNELLKVHVRNQEQVAEAKRKNQEQAKQLDKVVTELSKKYQVYLDAIDKEGIKLANKQKLSQGDIVQMKQRLDGLNRLASEYKKEIDALNAIEKKSKAQIDALSALNHKYNQVQGTVSNYSRVTESVATGTQGFSTRLTGLTTVLGQVGGRFGYVVGGASSMVATLGPAGVAVGALVVAVMALKKALEVTIDAYKGMLTFGIDSTKVFADFERSIMNAVAVTGEGKQVFSEFSKTAQQVALDFTSTSTDLSKGLIVLGQAGFSSGESMAALRGVAELTQATFTDLAGASDLLTTTIRAFGREAGEASNISQVFAAAINNSKLTLDNLRTAFNYVANSGEQLNVSVEELSAALGTLQNNGVRASTMATGLRGFMGALVAPTARFKSALDDVGLSVDDIDPRVYGLGETLRRLRDAGFDVEKAYEGLDKRIAATTTTLIQNADMYDNLVVKVTGTAAATQNAALQMDTLKGQFQILLNVLENFRISIGERTEASFLLLLETLNNSQATLEKFGNMVVGITNFTVNVANGFVRWAQESKGLGISLDLAKVSAISLIDSLDAKILSPITYEFNKLASAATGVASALASMTGNQALASDLRDMSQEFAQGATRALQYSLGVRKLSDDIMTLAQPADAAAKMAANIVKGWDAAAKSSDNLSEAYRKYAEDLEAGQKTELESIETRKQLVEEAEKLGASNEELAHITQAAAESTPALTQALRELAAVRSSLAAQEATRSLATSLALEHSAYGLIINKMAEANKQLQGLSASQIKHDETLQSTRNSLIANILELDRMARSEAAIITTNLEVTKSHDALIDRLIALQAIRQSEATDPARKLAIDMQIAYTAAITDSVEIQRVALDATRELTEADKEYRAAIEASGAAEAVRSEAARNLVVAYTELGQQRESLSVIEDAYYSKQIGNLETYHEVTAALSEAGTELENLKILYPELADAARTGAQVWAEHQDKITQSIETWRQDYVSGIENAISQQRVLLESGVIDYQTYVERISALNAQMTAVEDAETRKRAELTVQQARVQQIESSNAIRIILESTQKLNAAQLAAIESHREAFLFAKKKEKEASEALIETLREEISVLSESLRDATQGLEETARNLKDQADSLRESYNNLFDEPGKDIDTLNEKVASLNEAQARLARETRELRDATQAFNAEADSLSPTEYAARLEELRRKQEDAEKAASDLTSRTRDFSQALDQSDIDKKSAKFKGFAGEVRQSEAAVRAAGSATEDLDKTLEKTGEVALKNAAQQLADYEKAAKTSTKQISELTKAQGDLLKTLEAIGVPLGKAGAALDQYLKDALETFKKTGDSARTMSDTLGNIKVVLDHTAKQVFLGDLVAMQEAANRVNESMQTIVAKVDVREATGDVEALIQPRTIPVTIDILNLAEAQAAVDSLGGGSGGGGGPEGHKLGGRIRRRHIGVLEAGEMRVPADSAESIGVQHLAAMNKLARGGRAQRVGKPGMYGGGDKFMAYLQPNDFILRKEAVRALFGSNRFASGGAVGITSPEVFRSKRSTDMIMQALREAFGGDSGGSFEDDLKYKLKREGIEPLIDMLDEWFQAALQDDARLSSLGVTVESEARGRFGTLSKLVEKYLTEMGTAMAVDRGIYYDPPDFTPDNFLEERLKEYYRRMLHTSLKTEVGRSTSPRKMAVGGRVGRGIPALLEAGEMRIPAGLGVDPRELALLNRAHIRPKKFVLGGFLGLGYSSFKKKLEKMKKTTESGGNVSFDDIVSQALQQISDRMPSDVDVDATETSENANTRGFLRTEDGKLVKAEAGEGPSIDTSNPQSLRNLKNFFLMDTRNGGVDGLIDQIDGFKRAASEGFRARGSHGGALPVEVAIYKAAVAAFDDVMAEIAQVIRNSFGVSIAPPIMSQARPGSLDLSNAFESFQKKAEQMLVGAIKKMMQGGSFDLPQMVPKAMSEFPALLEAGEMRIPASMAQTFGRGLLSQLNSLRFPDVPIRKMAAGGSVDAPASGVLGGDSLETLTAGSLNVNFTITSHQPDEARRLVDDVIIPRIEERMRLRK